MVMLFYINTHGTQTTWQMETGKSYEVENAINQINNCNSIFVTDACLTNAFDSSSNGGCNDPCLSEAFIRNPKNGVVAYLGGSRFGWSPTQHYQSLAYSQLLSAYFFKELFNPNNSYRNFGNLIREAKLKLISLSDSYNVYKWLQYSVNPIGDPEMDIYIDNPSEFSNLSVYINKSELIINTHEYDCRICVMSHNDYGETYFRVFNNVENISLNEFPLEGSICITKSGYKPKIYRYTLIQNATIDEPKVYSADIIKVGQSITDAAPEGNVVIKSKGVVIDAKEIILERGTTVKKGATLTIYNSKKK